MINFISSNLSLLGTKIIEQLYLVLLSLSLALIIGLPLGIILVWMPKLKNSVLNIISALWTIPSLALLALFIPFLGIGFKPAIITLAIYAFLPIVRNTIIGLENVPRENIEAADGLGFTKRQRMFLVEFPLALPVIIGGIRIASIVVVGVATLAAFVGAGGLGDFINQGLALNNSRLLLLGAIPAAAMALLFDFILGKIETFLVVKQSSPARTPYFRRIVIALGIIIFIAGLVKMFLPWSSFYSNNATIRVASKNFSEQIILGELMAELLEAKTNLHVIRKFNLGTTAICQAALLNNQIDIYPEYTGTAYLTVLNYNKPQSYQTPAQIYQTVKRAYLHRYNLLWLPKFGFNNTQAMVVRADFAKRYNLINISDLIPIQSMLVMGAPAEFLKRPDGFIGLNKTYGLKFAAVKQMDPGLMYQAINSNAVNIINAFSTDGRIIAYHLVTLRDDKHLYLPYDAAAIIRPDILSKHKAIYSALQPLFGLLDDKTMQQLNYQVDVLKRSPAEVAHDFLEAKKLVK